MSEFDLSAAVEAAAEAAYERTVHRTCWADLVDGSKAVWRSDVRGAVTAAAPLIERQVREQVAREIEVEMRRHDHAQVGFSAIGDAYAHAARIARGGTS